jgi:hypothetical protein
MWCRKLQTSGGFKAADSKGIDISGTITDNSGKTTKSTIFLDNILIIN